MMESIQELQQATTASQKLTTFYNYIESWILYFEQIYGTGEEGLNRYISAIGEHKNVKRLKGGATLSKELCNAYHRGQLTFRVLDRLPIDKHPELALSALFWLPVQSYYAINGVGIATMIALNKTPPKNIVDSVQVFQI